MNRPADYWIWLLGDVSLDRALPVLSVIGFPTEHHRVLQQCIDSVGAQLRPGMADAKGLVNAIRQQLGTRLGDRRLAIEQWIQDFPFTSESEHAELFYWDYHFNDLLAVDIADPPPGVGEIAWRELIAAYRGNAPIAGNMRAALGIAAAARKTVLATNDAIDKARAQPLSEHDLDIYMRFGWNDHGTKQGLSSLEIGARLDGVRQFWNAVAPYFPAEEIEELAYQRDMSGWRLMANPAAFTADAQRYGVSPEQMAADLFPMPKRPPGLITLQEQ